MREGVDLGHAVRVRQVSLVVGRAMLRGGHGRPPAALAAVGRVGIEREPLLLLLFLLRRAARGLVLGELVLLHPLLVLAVRGVGGLAPRTHGGGPQLLHVPVVEPDALRGGRPLWRPA